MIQLQAQLQASFSSFCTEVGCDSINTTNKELLQKLLYTQALDILLNKYQADKPKIAHATIKDIDTICLAEWNQQTQREIKQQWERTVLALSDQESN